MVLRNLTVYCETNRQLYQSGCQSQRGRLSLGEASECVPAIHACVRSVRGLWTKLRLPWVPSRSGAGENSQGHQANRNLHERRWARSGSRIELVELRLPLSAVASTMGNH